MNCATISAVSNVFSSEGPTQLILERQKDLKALLLKIQIAHISWYQIIAKLLQLAGQTKQSTL